MDTIEYHTTDKSKWGEGAWQKEPDKKQWQDPATGYPCLIVRGPVGSLCGYVGVPAGHPFHGKKYDAFDDIEAVQPHGGLTFSDGCSEPATPEVWEEWRAKAPKWRAEAERYPKGDAAEHLAEITVALESYEAFVAYREARSVCHKVAPGEPDDTYWFGFDCAHAGDWSPKMAQWHTPVDDYMKHCGPGAPTGWGEPVTYRDLAYVTAECTKLAAQLAALK